MIGTGCTATETVTVLVSLPAEFVAVTVNAVDDKVPVGVPENSPELVENESPVGSDAEIDQLAIIPPVFEGINVDIAEFWVAAIV
jgi:hypothetical protein